MAEYVLGLELGQASDPTALPTIAVPDFEPDDAKA